MHRHLAAASLAGLLVAAGGCEIDEVVTPGAENVVVVEAILRPELRRQRLLLHQGLVEDPDPIAHPEIRIRDETLGVEYRLLPDRRDLCFTEGADDQLPAFVTCYVSREQESSWVVPGRSYTLDLRFPDGREATARTEVPARFALQRPLLPSGSGCRLEPDQRYTVVWSRSPGAWAYVTELEVANLRVALQDAGIDSIPDRIRLGGLAISETDTTMVLPSDFGVFQRTQEDIDLLIALRDGLPNGSVAQLLVAAVDRNYVNGVRGGVFNPSGRVRISSVHGHAIGVFGSATTQRALLQVARSGGTPCSS